MKALTFSEFGDSDVLEYIDIPAPAKKKDEILRNARDRIKFCRCVPTKGNYHLKGNPFIAGYEGAGVVVDSNNTEFNVRSHCIC
jgi:NADPH2:quinone reductase